MAQLPGGKWLISQSDGIVHLFHRETQEEILSFDPSDADAVAKAQGKIHASDQLDDEQKSFAHFWSGYFYAHSGGEYK